MIFIKKIYGWREYKLKNSNLWIKGIIYNFSDKEIFNKLNTIDRDKIKNFLKNIDGHFAIIFKKNQTVISAVDEISSIPIFYYKIINKFYITPFPKLLDKKFYKEKINDQLKVFSMSGFTIGEQTIFKNLYRMRAGSYILYDYKKNNFKKYNYYLYKNEKLSTKINYKNLFEKLSKINISIIKKLYKFSIVHKKNIAIPLSAGYDSRFVVSCLKHLGAKNVICFSYGQIKNFEAEAAKKISTELGYPWHFIKLDNSSTYRVFRSKKFKKFSKIFETYSSVSTADIAEFQVISELKERKILKNAIIVNGNSGDFISGNHIPKFKIANNKAQTFKNSIKAHIDKHYRLWDNLANSENDKIVTKLLIRELKNLKLLKKFNISNYHTINELLEFYDRQSKHVISKQRVYEYFGFDWSLPLWDKDYIEFWRSVNRKFKDNQNLYEDVLIRQNFGGVWKDKKWKKLKNDMTTRLIFFKFFIRPFFKMFFLIHGKSYWHKFERKYISFYTDILSNLGISRYGNLFFETRGFRNFLSIHTDKYLKNHEEKS